MLRFLVLASVILTVYAAVDCVRTPKAQVQNLPKAVWLALILLLPLIGPVSWLLAGKDRARPSGRPQRRPTAPDDDPDFLRRIDEQRRREQRHRDPADRSDEHRDDPPA